jgi:DNA-binding FadR family transcriptional regulator
VHERHTDREWIDKTLALVPRFGAARQINVTYKRAGQIARNLVIDIIRKRLPPGVRLGAEADLCRRYRISRSVGRQVIGLLEEIDVAHCERGRGRGVYVHAPSPSLGPKIAHSFLASRHVSSGEAREIGNLIETTGAFERDPSNPILALLLESLRDYSGDAPN